MANATFVLKKIDTFPLRVELAIPPENPVMKGHLTIDCKVKTKGEVRDLQERGLTDSEYFAEVATAVHGLGTDAGDALEGAAAMAEFTEGRYSMYLLQAFITAYFEQYGEARRKNGQRLRGR